MRLLVVAPHTHLILLMTSVQILDVSRVLKVRTNFGNAACFSRRLVVFLILAVIVPRIYSTRHVGALVAGSVGNLVSIIACLTASPLRVHLRYPI